ncbi:imelysin family protein [Shewanella sp. 1_MG-2023]|uniref:imelysin family protein n=1 Tax=unclassified Shewanella TaxID=196818 RepID=UPI0026E39156|nr:MULTISPECIES: imelysin family protein [unclassified Shewanella]MDO6610503.1 imelysin family protein [Shewanella sp. 7_MG-2023]MDO6770628.1 imelysin family protein [Shewanella sp. 2_MG-2023]MDO6795014.1 imelysin family protein [Shewanella sp. 1_MG-2023]
MNFKYTAIALTLMGTLAACGGSGSDSSDTGTTDPVVPETGFTFAATEMVTNLTDDVIVAGYADLAAQGDALLLATQKLLNSTSQADLVAAQDAWKAARKPWEQGESHIFGPVDSLSIDPHLDSWPLNTTDLQTQLDNSNGFDAETIKSWNDDVQGFHTIEFLLFGDGVNDNTKLISELTTAEREYVIALSEVFRDYAVQLDDAWQVSHNPQDTNALPYADLLKSPGSDSNTIYSSELAVIEELINGMIGIVDEVGNGKIADPFGDSLANADTSKVESQYSWNSLTDFADNIQGVRNVYQGEFIGGADKQGIIDFVAAADSDLSVRIASEIDDSILKIQAISGSNNMPFRQAILDEDGRARIETAVTALTTLQASLESDVIPLLSEWNAQ